jgi:hypothetical protein
MGQFAAATSGLKSVRKNPSPMAAGRDRSEEFIQGWHPAPGLGDLSGLLDNQPTIIGSRLCQFA